MASATASKKAPKKASKPAQDSAAFGPIAERFRRAGDLDRAISLCREGLQKYPQNISARVTLGWALLEQGSFDDARTELEFVLRRAPDNLAAIRGLAELHDRAEHTLNLPMDGPGQWPPPPEAVEGQPVAPQSAKEKARKAAVEPPAESVWLPVQQADESESAAGPMIAPAELGLALWSSIPETAPAPVPVLDTAAGMSSVRELDPNAAAVTFEVPSPVVPRNQAEELVAGPSQTSARAIDVPALVQSGPEEVDIAALIAEVDSLEAAAAADAVIDEPPALVLDAGLDLDVLTEVGLAGPAELDLRLGHAAAADSPVEELVAWAPAAPAPAPTILAAESPVAEELVAERVAEALVVEHLEPEPPFVLTPPAALTVVDLGEDPAEADGGAIVWDTASAPRLDFDAPAVLVASAEAAPEISLEAAADAAPEIILEAAPEVIPVAALEIAPPVLAAVEEAASPVEPPVPLPFLTPQSPTAGPVASATVLALERFLRQVQVRRRQLVTESVA